MKCVDPAHQRVVQTFGHALTLDDHDAWLQMAFIFAARLSAKERAGLAWAALLSCDGHDAEAVAESVFAGAGQPCPPLFGLMDEASWWADWADPREIEAYALACFNRMDHRRQAAFLTYVNGKAAA